jgi:hypothetical protein
VLRYGGRHRFFLPLLAMRHGWDARRRPWKRNAQGTQRPEGNLNPHALSGAANFKFGGLSPGVKCAAIQRYIKAIRRQCNSLRGQVYRKLRSYTSPYSANSPL